MHICIVTKSTFAHCMGGMERHVQNLAAAARELGHTVTVLTTAHPAGTEREEADGIVTEYIAGTHPGCYSSAWWELSARRFAELNAVNSFSVVFGISLSGYALSVQTARPPLYPVLYGLMRQGIVSQWRQAEGIRGLARWLVSSVEYLHYGQMEDRMLRSVDGVLATSEKIAEMVRPKVRRIFISYNGIDAARSVPDDVLRDRTRERLGLPAAAKVTALIGSVEKQKGFRLGLEAFHLLVKNNDGGDHRLLIVGGGTDLPFLKRRAEELRLSGRVIFTGPVPADSITAYLNACDLFMHPSIRIEGLPTVILEAMACARPVVATDAGATTDAFIDGDCGYFVPIGNPDALAAKAALILSDEPLRRRLGEHARSRAARFDVKSGLSAFLREIPAGKGGPC